MKRILCIAALTLAACEPADVDSVPAGEAGAAPTPTAAAPAPPPISASMPQPGELPHGWLLAGMAPDQYEAAVDDEVVHQGRFSARLRAKVAAPRAFGTMSQSFDATLYRGSRVRLRGWLKAEGVANWCGLWLRVDHGGETAAIDNMQDRPVVGDQTWKQLSLVLDVPTLADKIAFGVMLDGAGTVWIDGLTLEKVDRSVPTTGYGSKEQPLPAAPTNLSFVD